MSEKGNIERSERGCRQNLYQQHRGSINKPLICKWDVLSFGPSDWLPKVNQVYCLVNRKYLRTRLRSSSAAVGSGRKVSAKMIMRHEWHMSSYYTGVGSELICVIGSVSSHMWRRDVPQQGAFAVTNLKKKRVKTGKRRKGDSQYAK